jgi:nitrite reductase/ring-hydroxylating ferredoxin subunit
MSSPRGLAPQRDYATLARPDRTHISLYTDPEVFQEEMKRIFYRSWVYVAHDSEVPNPGDYKTTFIGTVPVLVTRDEAGKVHVLINRCMHRGATVCPTEKGNARSFVCAYHGWEYALNGDLTAVAMPRGYNEGEIEPGKLGLIAARRVESYRGIIFASLLAEPDISLTEKLKGIKEYIDLYMDFSPAGEIVVGRTGVYKHLYKANWKVQVEGSVEGYHAPVTHATAFDIMIRKMAFPKDYQSLPLHGLDAGYGNNVLEVYRLSDEQVHKRWDPEFVDLLVQAHGREHAMEVLRTRFNLVCFPNFAILEYQFRVIRPIEPELSEVRIYHTTLKDVPARVNTRRVMEHQFFYGPAAFGGPDDYAMFDRIGTGFHAPMAEWVLLNRGYESETTDERGRRVGGHTQETQQRAPYYEYRRLMAQA